MTEEEVKEKLIKAGKNWGDFIEWNICTTVGIYDDGSLDYYEIDVDRFISGGRPID